jgi:AraC-like DNA-binding protein
MDGVAISCQILLMSSRAINLIGVGRVLPDPTWHMLPHQHTHIHELIVILAGKMRLRTPHSDFIARRGNLLFYRAGLVHEEMSVADDPVQTLFLSIRAPAHALNLPLCLEDRNGRIRQMAMWLRQDLTDGRDVKSCDPLLLAILDELKVLTAEPAEPWVLKLRAYMRDHMARKLSLDLLARQGGMSRFAFVRKYRQLTGKTPMADLRLIRLNEAQQLILSSHRPLKDIAAEAGLGDEFQLSKLFRRNFGLPPRDFRGSRKGSSPRP